MYNKEIDKKWQKVWEEKNCFHATNDSDKEKFYAFAHFQTSLKSIVLMLEFFLMRPNATCTNLARWSQLYC